MVCTLMKMLTFMDGPLNVFVTYYIQTTLYVTASLANYTECTSIRVSLLYPVCRQ